MNETIQLLQDVVRNAQTGCDAIDQLMHKTESPAMRSELSAERSQYQSAALDGERALREAGGTPEPVGMMSRAGMWLGTELNTLIDRSDEHIAEMLIQGATMGVIEMTKSMNAYADAAPDARSLASTFIVTQNEIINRAKNLL